MREVFVYYRVADERAASAQALVARLQAQVRDRHPGLETRLLRRPEAVGDVWTWMETYAWPQSAEGVTVTLQAEIEAAAAGLMALLEGARHTEVFEPW